MKIALIYSFKESDWFSVTKILKNLLAAYEHAYGKENLVHINVPWDANDDDMGDAAKQLLAAEVDKIVFLDHKPNPVYFLKEVGREKLLEFEEVVFHIYGDFTLEFHRWNLLDSILMDANVKFICASKKQSQLVANLLNENIKTFICPFPVADKEFYFDQSKNDYIREKYNLKKTDTVFLYVGRLSTQKRNLETIETFLSMRASGKLDASHKFLIAGGFDLLGQHYLREGLLLGEYFRRVMHLMERYPKEVTDSVQLLGSIENSDLIPFYNTADYFLSMSTYHDEDYGMAIAEALCCGLPCILTDWAGYSSFNLGLDQATRYVPVKLGRKSPEFDCEKLITFLSDAKKSKVADSERKDIAQKYHENYTVSACAEILKTIHSADKVVYKGFSDMLHRLGYIMFFKRAPFLNEFDNCFNKFYYKVYGCYAGEN